MVKPASIGDIKTVIGLILERGRRSSDVPKKKERVDLTQQRSVCIPLKESAITLMKETALWINLQTRETASTMWQPLHLGLQPQHHIGLKLEKEGLDKTNFDVSAEPDYFSLNVMVCILPTNIKQKEKRIESYFEFKTSIHLLFRLDVSFHLHFRDWECSSRKSWPNSFVSTMPVWSVWQILQLNLFQIFNIFCNRHYKCYSIYIFDICIV